MKHVGFTPGPWRDVSMLGRIDIHGPKGPEQVIAATRERDGNGRPTARAKADARLLADAPTLLAQRDAAVEALKAINEWGLRSPGIDPTWDKYNDLINQMKAAIAAAEGEAV